MIDTARVEALFRNVTVRSVARQHSPPGMAEDAISRAMLIVMEKMPPDLSGDDAARWTVTVVKREGWALHRQQSRFASESVLSRDDNAPPFVERSLSPKLSPHEQVERSEAVERRMKALAQLKPDEKRALVLHEVGYSYRELMRLTGWSYTKINRCMAEGRRRLYELLDPDDLEPERLSEATRATLRRRGVLAVA